MNEQFNHEDAIDMATYIAFRSTFRLDKFVRRLVVNGTCSDCLQLNFSNMVRLEQLKIELENADVDTTIELDINASNLTMLEINYGFSIDLRKLCITAPNLKMLKCVDLDRTQFTHPNTIHHLKMKFYGDQAHMNRSVDNLLKNVQHLEVQHGFCSEQSHRNVLSVFPKLTTLACNFSCEDFELTSIQNLRYIFKQKRPELKIFLQSVELVGITQIDECESSESDFAFQMNNFKVLCHNVAVEEINYNYLMKLVDGKLPDDFCKKFYQLECLRVVGEVKSQEYLLGFIRSFDYLRTLVILRNTSLGQRFFDNLLNSLTHLEVGEISDSVTNFDFLFKLDFLEKLLIDRESPDFFDLALDLFKRLNFLTLMRFMFKKNSVVIVRKPISKQYDVRYVNEIRSAFSVGYRDILHKKQINFDQMVRLFDFIKACKTNLTELPVTT